MTRACMQKQLPGVKRTLVLPSITAPTSIGATQEKMAVCRCTLLLVTVMQRSFVIFSTVEPTLTPQPTIILLLFKSLLDMDMN